MDAAGLHEEGQKSPGRLRRETLGGRKKTAFAGDAVHTRGDGGVVFDAGRVNGDHSK
jgi:hypothetical protein